jgi:dihydrodipicolinate synthase/N-acetylneuraminate lyase
VSRDSVLSWRGVHAVMVTPFDRALGVDWGGLRANTEFLVEGPVDVIVCLGSEGEFYALSDRERQDVAASVLDTVAGRKPVVIGVSHPSSVVAATFARHARESGASAVMATAPYFARTDEDGLSEHFTAIGAEGVPLFLYNSPGRTGVSMSPATIARIAHRSGAIGVKQAAPDIAELADLLAADLPPGFVIVGGAEVAFWPALCVGAVGNTATAASAVPAVFAALWEAAQAGRMAEGRDLYARLATLRRAYALAGNQAAVVKALMDLVGLAGGPPRPPVRPLSDAARAMVQASYDELAADRA